MPFQFRKEAIEEDLNSNFPSQGQGNPPLYYSLSEVVVPTYSINQSAEGTSLPSMLQTAWDFSTGYSQEESSNSNIVTNPGFWKIDLVWNIISDSPVRSVDIRINDGLGFKTVFSASAPGAGGNFYSGSGEDSFVVFLRSGDSLNARSNANDAIIDVWYRQIADINGNLINPLGFSFA